MEGFIIFLLALVFSGSVVAGSLFLAWIMLFPSGKRWMMEKQMMWEARQGFKETEMRETVAAKVRDRMIADLERKAQRGQHGR